MKSILLSIRPEWVEKILNGKKTIEVRKKFPKDYQGWVYVYCTKDRKFDFAYLHTFLTIAGKSITEINLGNGKIVARFWCDNVERFYNAGQWVDEEPDDIMNIICNNACISRDDLDDYCEGRYFYAIHISKLEIFDKPKELSDFGIKRAPQNYCYVKGE